MDLSYSSEQDLLRESALGFLSAPRGATDTQDADDPRVMWKAFAEMGWLALPIPEVDGGLGQGPVDVGILTEAFGRSFVREPYVPTVVLCGGIIAAAGSAAQRGTFLPAIVAGQSQVALAHAEPAARDCRSHVETRARRQDGGWMIEGEKSLVLDGAGADMFLVTARIVGDLRDTSGIGVFALPCDQPGLFVEAFPAVDGSRYADLTLTGASVDVDALLGADEDAFRHLDAAADAALAAWAFEIVGIMAALLDATLEHTRTRTQFGKPLAANQVIRHRLADMSIACEEARSSALRGALLLGSDDVRAAARAVSSAKVKIGALARQVAEDAIQMHGAMGVTDELPIGSLLKRILALEPQLGSPDHHLHRHAALSRELPSSH